MEKKQNKDRLMYVFLPDSSYRCQECVFAKDTSTGQVICTFFTKPEEKINWYGSCDYWVKGKVGSVEGPHAKTKLQSGYAENKPGLQCRRCEYMNPDYHKCKKVDENSPGDTPGEINPKACCNSWDKHDTFGNMTDKELDNFKNFR